MGVTEEVKLPDWTTRIDLAPLSLLVGWTAGSKIEVRRVKMTQAVGDALAKACDLAVGQLRSKQGRLWTPEAADEIEEYLYAPKSKLDPRSQVLAALNLSTFTEMSAQELPSKSLLFYALLAGTGDKKLIFLRKQNPKTALEHRTIAFYRDRLEHFAGTLFIFDNKIDLVFDSDLNLSILSLGVFNLLFKSTPDMLRVIPEYVQGVAALLPMSETTMEFLKARAISDTRMRKRLDSIMDRNHLKNVTIEELRNEIERQELDPDSFIKDGKLDVSKANITDMLKILNEDLFIGGLSGERFEVARKSTRRR